MKEIYIYILFYYVYLKLYFNFIIINFTSILIINTQFNQFNEHFLFYGKCFCGNNNVILIFISILISNA